MRKFVLISGFAFAAVGAVLTIIVIATVTSESFPFSFDFGMTVITPAVIVGRALGLEYGAHAWLWAALAFLLNTGLCFSAGAVIGYIVYHVTKGFAKRNETTG